MSSASRSRYSTAAIALHWLTAGVIAFQIVLGWRMGVAPKGPLTYTLFQLHKSVGVTILALAIIRLALRIAIPPPPVLAAKTWERWLVHLAHWGFYVALVGLPLTGWVVVSASDIQIPTLLYGRVPWPHLPGLAHLPVGQRHMWRDGGEAGHLFLVWSTLALLAAHLAGVLKHELVTRDGVLARMIPGVRSGAWADPRLWVLLGGVVAAAAAGWFVRPAQGTPALAPPASMLTAAVQPPAIAKVEPVAAPLPAPSNGGATPWAVAPGSTLGFRTQWAGEPLEGRFQHWTADIVFDPDALDKSSVAVAIDLASVSTGDGQRDAAMSGEDWFDVAAHPKATFRSHTFRRLGPDRFEAMGTFSLRGVSRPLTLPFSLKIVGPRAQMRAAVTIDRTIFGVGQGEWSATDQIPADVSVDVRLVATRKGGVGGRPTAVGPGGAL